MPERVSACGSDRSSHQWTEAGNRKVCQACDFADFGWSLSRRQMIEALRHAGTPSSEVR